MVAREEQCFIPGLPEDLTLDCLARIPHRFHHEIRPVCRKWRDLVTAPSFHRHRHRIGAAEDLFLLVQVEKTGQEHDRKHAPKSVDPVTKLKLPAYVLSLYNATFDTWHRVATPEAVPMFAQVAAVGSELVLIGGWDPVTLDPVTDVRILELSTMTWREGRPMPAARSFFACAAVGGRVYVAGGHDGQKNGLRSAAAYDVKSDEWVSLPPMAEERDECKGLASGGKFCAVSGYGTDSQGRFATSAEWFDPEIGEWRKEEGFSGEIDGRDGATCASCFGVGDKILSVDLGKGVREYEGREKGWRVVGPPPEGMRSSTCAAQGGDRVFVTGGDGSAAWVMDLGSRKWVRVETPVRFSGFVYSVAAVRI